MKIEPRRIAAFLAKPDPAVHLILLYGPDQGLVRERAEKLTQEIVGDLQDPFRIAQLSFADISADPARLSDEAAAIAFGGGRRVVRLRPPGDSGAKAIEAFLADPKGDSLIIAEAGDLAKNAPIRKLCEDAAVAAAVPCYADDAQSLRQWIATTLGTAGLRIDGDAEDYLRRHLGPDRGMNRQALDKLILYAGTTGRVSLADVEACVGDSAEADLDAIADATASGSMNALDTALARAYHTGESAIAILRRVQTHFQRLHYVAGAGANGQALDTAIAKLRPPPFFRRAAAFRMQAERWSLAHLERAGTILLEAEIACKSTGAREQPICRQALLRIAAAANSGRR